MIFSSIVVFFKRKLEYKSIYMSSYVHPNIVIKVLQIFCQTPLYKSGKKLVRPKSQNLVELRNYKIRKKPLKSF
jgi:hypothetical protein